METQQPAAGFEHCPYCGSTRGFVYVHSHYQCTGCGNNVNPCCGGDQEHEINNKTDGEEERLHPDGLLNEINKSGGRNPLKKTGLPAQAFGAGHK